MICIETEIETEIDTFPPRAVVPPPCSNWHKKAQGFGMPVEKRDKCIVIYRTESEHQALTWAADRARRRPSEAIRLVAIDWAKGQQERAHQERGQA